MRKITFLLLIISFISCDPELTNNYVVENRSDHLIETEFKLMNGFRTLNSADTIQKIRIEPNSKVKIFDYGEIGSAHDKEQYFLEAFDTLSFYIKGLEITKKVRERNSWNYEVVKQGGLSMDEVEYKLVIENEDLEN